MIGFIGSIGVGRAQLAMHALKEPGEVVVESVPAKRDPFAPEPIPVRAGPKPFEYEDNKPRERGLPTGTDIYREYNLIQEKKSTLSKWEREHVINLIEKSV